MQKSHMMASPFYERSGSRRTRYKTASLARKPQQRNGDWSRSEPKIDRQSDLLQPDSFINTRLIYSQDVRDRQR